ncbi:MAG: phosphatidylserine decarboxylase family protein [Prevotella sp.]|jgi:phosphatidylserine decarboxylase|nr:phosphatidylserine decarboxylase family protein [Prevotella sp.]MBP3750503.1 phosphatidylserine decarboxylase family protein [Prevotella sp.]MBQ1650602.1 phosphatidylserine decarboxylase family protein [Prevotella sp.]MBQ4041232.1 phosphatidylserine decarboxylase family protein [Prevotella sp.]MBR4378694.1 phosphatidylserine decarboxylase family protein [Prevotella sp.]
MGEKIQKLKKIKKIKKIRIHREGTDTLIYSAMVLIAVGVILWRSFDSHIPFYAFAVVFGILWCIVLNFFRCPIRFYGTDDTDNLVIAPADGHVVVIEDVEETQYFHEKRKMVSIFMNLWNVHANWFPVDGTVKMVRHKNGKFHRAWLPKAAEENEMSDIIITTPDGIDILCRQIAGAMARRIVTYAKEGDTCYIDEHLGFIKFGSRVDLYLPIDTEIKVTMGQSTTGNQTVIGILK